MNLGSLTSIAFTIVSLPRVGAGAIDV